MPTWHGTLPVGLEARPERCLLPPPFPGARPGECLPADCAQDLRKMSARRGRKKKLVFLCSTCRGWVRVGAPYRGRRCESVRILLTVENERLCHFAELYYGCNQQVCG